MRKHWNCKLENSPVGTVPGCFYRNLCSVPVCYNRYYFCAPESCILKSYICYICLHWLPFPQRISLRISSLMWRSCMVYLQHSSCAGRRTLRSSVHGNLVVPFATMQAHSFAVVGLTTWNGLPIDLIQLRNGACSQFHHLLKTV